MNRLDNCDHKLKPNSLIHLSSLGMFHTIKDENHTSCGIDFEHRDFEIGLHDELIKSLGKCKRCAYYDFNHKSIITENDKSNSDTTKYRERDAK